MRGFKYEAFVFVVDQLSRQIALPEKYKDHSLTGNFLGLRECHIAPDILLVYEIDEGVLTLTLLLLNIGNHAQLFK